MSAGSDASLPQSPEVMLTVLKLQLAVQVAPRSWRRPLREVTVRLTQSGALDAAQTAEVRMPAELRGILESAYDLPDPGKFVLQAMAGRLEAWRAWRRFLRAISYPLFCAVFAMAVSLGLSTAFHQVIGQTAVDELEKTVRDFQLTKEFFAPSLLVQQHDLVVGLAAMLGWIFAASLIVYFCAPRWAWVSLLGSVPLLGAATRWIYLRETLHRFQLLLAQGKDPVSAMRSVAVGFRSRGHGRAASAIARRMEAGAALGHCFSESILADSLCGPLLASLDTPDTDTRIAIERTIVFFDEMVRNRCRMLSSVLPMLLTLFVMVLVLSTLGVYYLVQFDIMRNSFYFTPFW